MLIEDASTGCSLSQELSLIYFGGITQLVPIEHDQGDVTAESGNLSHWWKNNTDKPAVLISSDVLPPMKSADGMM